MISFVHHIDPELTESLVTAVPEAFGGHVNDALLGALARAVRSWQTDRTGGSDDALTVLVEGHGRYEEVLATAPGAVAPTCRDRSAGSPRSPRYAWAGTDVVHAVKAARRNASGQPDSGAGFGFLRYGLPGEVADRPLPPIIFNYLGAGGRTAKGAAVSEKPDEEPQQNAPLPFSRAGAPGLSALPAGRMIVGAPLSINASVDGLGRLSATVSFPSALFTEDEVRDLADRWTSELSGIVEFVAAGNEPGPSPSDIPGTDLTQHDLDVITGRFPGAAIWPPAPLQQGLFFQSELAAGTAGAVDVCGTGGCGTRRHRRRPASRSRAGAHPPPGVAFGIRDRTQRCGGHGGTRTCGAAVDRGRPRRPRRRRGTRPGGGDRRRTAGAALRFVRTAATAIRPCHARQFVDARGHQPPSDPRRLVRSAGDGRHSRAVRDGRDLHPYRSGRSDFGDYLDLIWSREKSTGEAAWRQVLAPVVGPTLVAPGYTASKKCCHKTSERS